MSNKASDVTWCKRSLWAFCPYCGACWGRGYAAVPAADGKMFVCGRCESRFPDYEGWIAHARDLETIVAGLLANGDTP